MDASYEIGSVQLHQSSQELLRALLGNEIKDEFAVLLNTKVPTPASCSTNEEPPCLRFPALDAVLAEIASCTLSETLHGILEGMPSWGDISVRIHLSEKLTSIGKQIVDGIPSGNAGGPYGLLLEASKAILAAKSVDNLKRQIDKEMGQQLQQVAAKREEVTSEAKGGEASAVELITMVYRTFLPELDELAGHLEAGLIKDLGSITELVADIGRAAQYIEGES
ncbi:MAG: hypothetical protein FJY85_07655 [Deltaproteobacteria bacterium]|nr:hypothetical protein [Deltaproteobacteria bacterium]